jgi:hypothetical protein
MDRVRFVTHSLEELVHSSLGIRARTTLVNAAGSLWGDVDGNAPRKVELLEESSHPSRTLADLRIDFARDGFILLPADVVGHSFSTFRQ